MKLERHELQIILHALNMLEMSAVRNRELIKTCIVGKVENEVRKQQEAEQQISEYMDTITSTIKRFETLQNGQQTVV